MASASWHKETDEKINYTKLCRLLVDGGTQAVRSVFDGIHPSSSLKATFNANRTILQDLKNPRTRRQRKVLNDEQWDKLYPPSGSNPKSEDFDITLLFVLLRNICGLTPPATGWDVLPPVTDTSREANLARIKNYRNNTIAHKPNTEINDADFQQHWQDISCALLSLGLSQDDIDDLESDPLGKKDYNQLLNEWYMSDKDIKTQLEDIKTDTEDIKSDTGDLKSDTADIKLDTADLKSDTTDIKSDTADLKSDTADIKSDTADIKSDTADIKSDTTDIKSDTAAIKAKLDNIESHKMDQLINKLAISDFRAEISTKYNSFHPNTRQWILDQVKSHVDSQQPEARIMLITAGPGMGKSTIAAKIYQTYQDLGRLAGCHFFQFNNSTRNNARLMLQSIARQMCDTVPGYREALERKLQTDLGKRISEMNCEELLTILLEEPLCSVKQTDCNLVVVIDALDECPHDSRDELLKALRKKLPCFPSWLRFFLTSRPSTDTSDLGSIAEVEIKPEDQANLKDLKLFFGFELKALYPQYVDDNNAYLVQSLVEMTKGLFLVAYFVIEYLKRENVASPEKVLELFPKGISSVYEIYFSRLKDVVLPYISEEERFYKILEAVVATKDLLPVNMFYNILCLKSEHEVPRQERKGRKDAVNALHWLFPVEGDHVTTFHKLVFDWLTLQDVEAHGFSVRVEDGEVVLADQCLDVLSGIRNGKKDLDKPLTLTDSEKYSLGFLYRLIHKNPSVLKADKYGSFSNVYLLTAITIENFRFSIREGVISHSLLKIVQYLQSCLCSPFEEHDPSCHLFRPVSSFGHYLAFFLQAAHAMEVSEETTPNPLDFLKENYLPYFNERCLLQTPLTKGYLPMVLSNLQGLLKCKEGFIAVFPTSCSNSLSTAVYMFELDGRLIRKKSFPGQKFIFTSPNINFIVMTAETGNNIEILNIKTLGVVSEFKSPHDVIESCHVFGDGEDCFVVIKGYQDNKVYVIEGLTGQVHNTITVTEDSYVKSVSCRGHISVIRTAQSLYANLVFMQQVADRNDYSFRGFFLYHCDRGQEPIPVSPPEEMLCCCSDCIRRIDMIDIAVRFSEDGRLFAYIYEGFIFIVNTSDGSIFKSLRYFDDKYRDMINILFVSESYIMLIHPEFILTVINVQTDETEHQIYLPHHVLPNSKLYLLFPEEGGKSLTLINSHEEPDSYEVSSLVFHNLNLQGLR